MILCIYALNIICSHFISSGRWDTLSLAADQTKQRATVLDALSIWMNHNISGYVANYMDICHGTISCSEINMFVLQSTVCNIVPILFATGFIYNEYVN